MAGKALMALDEAAEFGSDAESRRIRVVAEGIDKMSSEEAGYWMGMAVHRVYPRRELAALRLSLTTP